MCHRKSFLVGVVAFQITIFMMDAVVSKKDGICIFGVKFDFRFSFLLPF